LRGREGEGINGKRWRKRRKEREAEIYQVVRNCERGLGWGGGKRKNG